MRISAARLLALVGIFFFGSFAFAQSGYVSGFVGYAQPDLDNIDSEINFGLKAGGYLSSELSLGAYIQFYRTEEGSGSSKFELDMNPIMAELNYYFFEVGDGAYISGKLGLVREKVKVTLGGATGSDSETETAFGIGFGGDFPVNEKFFINGEINYLVVMGDPEEYNVLNFNAGAGIRF